MSRENSTQSAQEYLQIQDSLQREQKRCTHELESVQTSLKKSHPQVVSEIERYNQMLNNARDRQTRNLFQKLKTIKADCYMLETYVFEERAAQEGYVPRLKKTLRRIADSLDNLRTEARNDFERIAREEVQLEQELEQLNNSLKDDQQQSSNDKASDQQTSSSKQNQISARPPPPAQQHSDKHGHTQEEEDGDVDFRTRIHKIDDRIKKNGGETGGWRDDEHDAFIVALQKTQPSLVKALHGSSGKGSGYTSVQAPHISDGQKDRICGEAHLMLPHRSLDECRNHLEWFIVYCGLLNKKRHIIYEWKQVRSQDKRKKMEEEEAQVNDDNDEKRRKEELARLRNRTAMQKAEVARWKAEKARKQKEEEEKKYHEEMKQELAQDREEARKRAAQKAALSHYRAMHNAEKEKHSRVEEELEHQKKQGIELTPEQKEHIRAKVEAQISQAQSRGKSKLQSQEEIERQQRQALDPRRDKRGVILMNFDETEAAEDDLEDDGNTAYVKGAGLFKIKKVHSDPQRARGSTTAWKHHELSSERERASNRNFKYAHERPLMMNGRAADSRGLDFTFGGRGTGKAVPTWRAA